MKIKTNKEEAEKLLEFKKNGFIRLDNLFSTTEINEIRRSFNKLISAKPKGVSIIYEDEKANSVVRSIMGWQRSKGILENFAKDERILKWVKKILGEKIEFHQTKYNPKAPNLKGKKWDPHRGDTFWCFKDGVPNPNKMISAFVALTKQSKKNGAVYVWNGSHTITLDQIKPYLIGLDIKKSTQEDTAPDLSLQVSPEKIQEFNNKFEKILLEGPAGTVWILSSSLLHASPVNQSKEVRDLVANVFRTIDNRPKNPRSENYLSEPPNGPL